MRTSTAAAPSAASGRPARSRRPVDGLGSGVHHAQGHANRTTQHQPDVDALVKRAGVQRIRFHDLPHSCATLMFAQGVDLQTIRDLLGHSSIGVTSAIYVDVLREVQRDAVDRLGHLFGADDESDT
ncbi:MAG: tyrosine-type recombinase/integrase [Pseudonocardiaceae bacterium]